MIKSCKQTTECGAAEPVFVEGGSFDTETGKGNLYTHRLCGEFKSCGGYVSIGPATDFTDLPRDEKQKAYELWAAAQPVESKPERRLRRHGWKMKFAHRHSQIRAAAKKRGKPQSHPAPKPLSARRQRANDRYVAQLEGRAA